MSTKALLDTNNQLPFYPMALWSAVGYTNLQILTKHSSNHENLVRKC